MADSILGPGSDCERLEQISDISSLEDSNEENGKSLSPLSIPMKRKRSSFEDDSASDQNTMHEPPPKTMKLCDNDAREASLTLDVAVSSDVATVERGLQVLADVAMSPGKRAQPTEPQSLPKQKHKKGKRRGKRIPNDEPANVENAGSGAESTAEHGGNAEAVYSNEEDAQIENMVEEVEAENPIKIEERKCIHGRFR